jgi:hypothetical protein
MFKSLSNFIKSNGMWIFVIIVVIFAIWLLTSYSNNKGSMKDSFYSSLDGGYNKNAASTSSYGAPVVISSTPDTSTGGPSQNAASANASISQPSRIVGSTASSTCGYVGQPVANPQDLLPIDKNSQWAALNPVNNNNPQIPDLLQAGNLIGLDTIGQTLKNANLQLRSDPIIPKKDIGPWNQSTYEPDLGRVPLELGCGQP